MYMIDGICGAVVPLWNFHRNIFILMIINDLRIFKGMKQN